MKKILSIVLAGAGVLLLVIGFTSSVAQAGKRYPTFCPIVCSIYIADDGSLALTPVTDTASKSVEVDGKEYFLTSFGKEESVKIIKNECEKNCTIYKVDGEKAFPSYEFSN